MVVPILGAAASPLLAWRDPIYIIAGFAGIVAMAILLLQPLLAGGELPGLPVHRSRRMHRWMGAVLVVAVIVHVAALWLTSPPDVVDALLFVSPTPFSPWGVIAMWCVLAAGSLALFRRRIPPRRWRRGHAALVIVVVVCSVVHALLIEGTMEVISKVALCALVLLATARVVMALRIWTLGRRGGA